MSFIYFFPNPATPLIGRAEFEAAGLGYALPAAGGVESGPVAAGPGGSPGLLAAVPPVNGPAVPLAYRPDAQRWRRGRTRWVEGKELTWWVGCDTARPPGPAELERETVYPGNVVCLRDGNEWIIPRATAIAPERPSTLPRVLELAEDGDAVLTRVDPRFEALSLAAFGFWLDWSGQSEEKDRQTAAEQLDLAVAALQVNYRVGKVEAIGLLSLLSTTQLGEALRALVDADAVTEFLKKKVASAPPAAPSASPT